MNFNNRMDFENFDEELMLNRISGHGEGNSRIDDLGMGGGNELFEPAPIVSQGSLIQVVPAIVQLPPSLRQNCNEYLDALGALNDENASRGGYPMQQRPSQTFHFPSRATHQQIGHFDNFNTPYFGSQNMDGSVNYSTTSSYSSASVISTGQPRNSIVLRNNKGKKGGNSVSMIMNSFGRST
jgi:hypothetical protein